MNDSTNLERRYRRLLKLYPGRYRAEHEQEMVSVLMDAAPEGQQRPRLADSANLVLNGLWMRLRAGRGWENVHHPRLWLMVRLLSGMWLLILTFVLCGFGRWWGLVLVPVALFHFHRALRIGRVIEGDGGDGGSPPLTRA